MRLSFLGIILLYLLSACVSETTYAPVTDISTIEAIPQGRSHRVQTGETLYSIAWRYGLDYKIVANINKIPSPYTIRAGQDLLLAQQDQNHKLTLAKQDVSDKEPMMNAFKPNTMHKKWVWPVRGNIVNSFGGLQKGINIAGVLGQPIYAAAGGEVVYSGSGLRGYGNLIIIKHNRWYLSAYAYNKVNLVNEGQTIQQGQKIAEMGQFGNTKPMLHFEIRRTGQPIDPVALLQTKS